MDSTASTSGSGALDAAKEQAGSILDQAKTTVTDTLDQGMGQATHVLDNASSALQDTAEALRDGDHDAFARYAESAADQVAQFTDAIRGKSVGQLLDETEAFARRDAGLFLGGAFVLGIFGARFLKASAPRGSARSAGNGGARFASNAGSAPGLPARRSGGGYGAMGYGAAGYGSYGSAGGGSRPSSLRESSMPSAPSRVESRTGTSHLPAGQDAGLGSHLVTGGGASANPHVGTGPSGTGSTGGGVPGGQRTGSGPSGTGSMGGGVPGSNS